MKNYRLSENNQGVTLVELIAVIAVLGIVIAAVTGFMITGAQMSSKVGNTATASIKEQTAVEFINERIWEAKFDTLDLDQKMVVIESKEYYAKLIIDGAVLGTYVKDGVNYVGYQLGEQEPIQLCPGTISFEAIAQNKVTYYINGEKHVVCLRVAQQENVAGEGDGGNT